MRLLLQPTCRDDICFALGLTDADSLAKSEESQQRDGAEEEEEEDERAGEEDDDQDGTQVMSNRMGVLQHQTTQPHHPVPSPRTFAHS